MRISRRNGGYPLDNSDKISEVEKYAAVQPTGPETKEIQESEAYNRVRPETSRYEKGLRKLNSGIHGIVISTEGYSVTIRVINSTIFRVNDYVRLDCTKTTRFIRRSRDIDLEMLMIGERVKVKYLDFNADKLAYTIKEVFSIEVY